MANGQLISVEVQDDLDALNATLGAYLLVQSKLTTEEVLAKKGKDLGIKLFQGFWNLRTKGGRGDFRGPLFKEAEARGWRTRVRSKEIYKEPYLSIWQFGRTAKMGMRKGGLKQVKGKKRSARGLLVAQELARRQRGIGLLGLSYLMFRKRNDKNDPKGWKLVENKTSRKFGILSRVTSGTDADGNAFFRIENFTPGIATVGERHGIFINAMRAAQADMAEYLVRKQMEALRKTLKRDNK
jgi:hypothetical protein